MDSSRGNIRGRRPAREAVARQATPTPVLVEIFREQQGRVVTGHAWRARLRHGPQATVKLDGRRPAGELTAVERLLSGGSAPRTWARRAWTGAAGR
jgi:hypothetical protein